MTVYMCKVYDAFLGDWIDLGVFSTQAKAEGAGDHYIMESYPACVVIDWARDANVRTDWYQDIDGRINTRVVTECELDKVL